MKRYPGVVVAFSGGVDSTLLLSVAKSVLGKRVIAVTVDSPLQSRSELIDAGRIARRLGVKHITIHVDTLKDRHIMNNSRTRCYYCKRMLFTRIKHIARKHGYTAIEATNRSDLRDHRPGITAMGNLGIESPLIQAGFLKADIRAAARGLGLPNWSKPSDTCLATRIPYGQKINGQILQRIEKAETYLQRFKLRSIRVRDHYPVARIEVNPEDFPKIVTECKKIVRHFHRIGYKYVTLDLNGYHTGSMDL